ncbi:MAG: hypothetical protein HZA78_07990, partial [Candidatus Schekmanbacteria bacterium]|nr:hypothetical protein [Candidatus Schekmanbacteria bacterium]
MSNERIILCGEDFSKNIASNQNAGPLFLCGPNRNVNLRISGISNRMVANIPPTLIDLLEIAAYVYCADQAATRGGDGVQNFGANWRRQFQFQIPVREPEIWSSEPVLSSLRDTLGFLSGTNYEFIFRKLVNPPSLSQYLDYWPGGAFGFSAEEIILFSGGLDSLAGIVQDTVVDKRKAALISHRTSPQIPQGQKKLLEDLQKRHGAQAFHIPVWVNKDNASGRGEYTSRTGIFLQASLAAVMARIFDLWRIR